MLTEKQEQIHPGSRNAPFPLDESGKSTKTDKIRTILKAAAGYFQGSPPLMCPRYGLV
jgi:hypothetical protein